MALTLNGSTGITGAGIGTIGPSGANITGIVTATSISNISSINSGKIGGRRNLVINGAMNVAQRGTSYTGTDNYNTVDRMLTSVSGLDENCTFSQHALTSSDTGPWAKGFRKSFHIQNGNQTSGAGAGDYVQFQHRLEAQNVASSGWDYTSSSSYITLSFWVRSSVAQNFYGYLRTKDGTSQLYRFETGSLSANTWTKITKTIPGNSNVTINSDNGEGLQINISPFWGTTYTASGVSLNAWGAYASGSRTPDYTSTWYTTNDSTFEITGLQLEVGDTATEFEHRSYGDELALCQRYFYNHADGAVATDSTVGTGSYYNASIVMSCIQFPVNMRTLPTFEYANSTNYYKFWRDGGNDQFATWTYLYSESTTSAAIQTESAVSGTAGQAGRIQLDNAAAYIRFNAEL